jgi:hypothetical protein
MTPEERFERIEQKIEFIVEQQAQFSIDLQALREETQQMNAIAQKQIAKLNEAVVGLIGMVGRLSDAQARTEASLANMAQGMRKWEEKAAETDERLNIFINFVERYLGERQKEPPAQA